MEIIYIDGPDTSGKTTFAKTLEKKYKNEGKKAEIVHFPRYNTSLGRKIKDILEATNCCKKIIKL